MATRYNSFGWYNPYDPTGQLQSRGQVGGQQPGASAGQQPGASAGQQPLRGLIVPAVPLWFVENGEAQDRNKDKVEVKTIYNVNADPPVSSSSSSATSASQSAEFKDKSKFRSVGVAICILAAFTAGIAVAYIIIGTGIIVSIPTTCLKTSVVTALHLAIRIVPFPSPICMFIIGLLCMIIKNGEGQTARAIFGLTLFHVLLLDVLLLLGGIGGVYESAPSCINTNPIEIVHLILPAILIAMGIIFFALSIYILVLLGKIVKRVEKSSNSKPTSTNQPNQTTITTTVTTPQQPAQPVMPVQPVIPAQPGQTVPFFQPAQPMQPQPFQPYPLQMPGQLAYGQTPFPGQPMYGRPSFPMPPMYPPPPPPPTFGASPYGRPMGRSPYGYNPFRGPSQMRPYRPNPYYF